MEEKYGVKRMLKRRNKKPGKRKKILTPIAAMKKEVRAYGFSFSLRAYFKQLFAVCVGVLLIGIGYSLRTPFLLSLAVMVTLMLPKLILSSLRIKHDKFKLRCSQRNCSRCECPVPHDRPPGISR